MRLTALHATVSIYRLVMMLESQLQRCGCGMMFTVYLVAAALLLLLSCGEGAVSGFISEKTTTGLRCKYSEIMRLHGKSPRGLSISSCTRNRGKNAESVNTSCKYFGGNPHLDQCSGYYNDNTPHQQHYYKMLAQSAFEDGRPCEKSSIRDGIIQCNLDYFCTEGDCLKLVEGSLKVQGVTCKYTEIRNPETSTRGIKIYSCTKDKRDLKKTCTYGGGNPYVGTCGDLYYNNNKEHQVSYIQSLAAAAMENGEPCAQPVIMDNIEHCQLKYPCEEGDCKKRNMRDEL